MFNTFSITSYLYNLRSALACMLQLSSNITKPILYYVWIAKITGEGTIDQLVPKMGQYVFFSTFAIFSNATRLGCQFAKNILLWVTYLSIYNISTLKTC